MDKEINNNGYDYVDLELPSGTLWVTCNIGAIKPSESGLYFQWGDTQGYTKNQVGAGKQFNWNHYKFSINGSNYDFSKYSTKDTKLDLEDDTAHINMGGDWHMPSPDQIKELIDNTKKSFTILCGVKGMKFTSKKDNSKSIFIPAAGKIWSGSVHNSGYNCGIWSSMLRDNYVDYGQYLRSYSGDAYVTSSFRKIGLPIRGVIDGKCGDAKQIKNKIINKKMEDRQKVYIQGNSERGDEVIKTLEDLGGRSMGNFDGKSTNIYYLINPDGVIGAVSIFDTLILPFIKEFYKEIELPRWKSEYTKRFFYINPSGIVGVNVWYDTNVNESYYEFGNCFKTFEEAEAARDKIRNLLNNEQ